MIVVPGAGKHRQAVSAIFQWYGSKQSNEEKTMLKVFGQQRAKRIKVVMTALRAAPNLGVFAPPYSPPHRRHELTGKRKGTLSLDLDGPYRLIIKPLHNPLPERPEDGLDWRTRAVEGFV